jgi:phosphomannomutase
MEALMIGVSGMRGTVGGTLTPAVVARMACALVAHLKRTAKPANGTHFRVVFARDTRPSGPWVRDVAVGALTAGGVEVIDLDVVTTPGAAMMTAHLGADAAVIATASHNPIQWNGLKIQGKTGAGLPPAEADMLKDAFTESLEECAPVSALLPTTRNSQTHALHLKRVLDHVDVNGISSKRFKVVLDSINGAGCVATATLLSKLGCQFVHLNATPDGRFAHEPEPTEANLRGLAAEVARQRAHVGFAQDPDADRLAVVDERGTYIGEEYTLVLAAELILGRRPGVAAANLSTSRMIDDVAAAHGSIVIRTPVGEANVVQGMLAHGAIIGGEGNGGVIDPRIVPVRDSLVGIAYVLQLMAQTGKTVSQLVAARPAYRMVKTKFDCPRQDAQRAVEALKREFARQRIDIQDGIRIDWDQAWVHARPSNTEPIMRIIAEAPDEDAAQDYLSRVRAVVNRALT